MKYTKIDIYSARTALDVIALRLDELGVNGCVIQDGEEVGQFLSVKSSAWDYADEEVFKLKDLPPCVTAYIPEIETDLLAAVKDMAGDIAENGGDFFGDITVSCETVDDSQWENEWKKYYRPFAVGKITIVPAWAADTSAADTSDLTITIDPSGSFGTGRHESTEMCLLELQGVLRGGEKVLDTGSGSGILSIAALLLGAAEVHAVDITETCAAKTRENILLNGYGYGRFKVYAGNILDDDALLRELGGGYDVITANIIADVIIAMSPLFVRFLKKGGVLITSGIIDERAGETAAALAGAGFTDIQKKIKNGWVAYRSTLEPIG